MGVSRHILLVIPFFLFFFRGEVGGGGEEEKIPRCKRDTKQGIPSCLPFYNFFFLFLIILFLLWEKKAPI